VMKMDISEQFKSTLSERSIAHIHTTFSDGLNSVEEFCRWACDHNIDTIVFTEHVRKELLYDFDDFLREIKHARLLFPALHIWTGVEAKLLPEGILDIPDEIVSVIQVLYFACHSFPRNIELYKKSFTKLFKDVRWKEHVRVWAHPGYFFKYSGFSRENSNILHELIEIALHENIVIENNLRYHLPPEHILAGLSPSDVIIGYDAHSIESILEIEKKQRLIK